MITYDLFLDDNDDEFLQSLFAILLSSIMSNTL